MQHPRVLRTHAPEPTLGEAVCASSTVDYGYQHTMRAHAYAHAYAHVAQFGEPAHASTHGTAALHGDCAVVMASNGKPGPTASQNCCALASVYTSLRAQQHAPPAVACLHA